MMGSNIGIPEVNWLGSTPDERKSGSNHVIESGFWGFGVLGFWGFGVLGTELGRLMLVLDALRPMFLPQGNLWRLSEEFPRRKIDENSSCALLNCCWRPFDMGLVVPVGLEVPGRTVATSSVVPVEGKALNTVLRVS